MKFKLHDIRESKVWKEAVAEGRAEHQREMINRMLAKGMPENQIAELMEVSMEELRRLENKNSG